MVLLRNYSILCCYLLYSQTIRTILCSLLLTISQQVFNTQNAPCSSTQSTITIYTVTSLPIQRVMAPLYALRLLYSHKQLAIVQIGIEYFHNSIYSCFPVLPTLSIVQCTNTISFYCYTLLHPVAWAILDTQTLCNLLQFNTINELQRKLGILLCCIIANYNSFGFLLHI